MQARARIRTCQNESEEQRIVHLADTRKQLWEHVKNESKEWRIMLLQYKHEWESERIKNENEVGRNIK